MISVMSSSSRLRRVNSLTLLIVERLTLVHQSPLALPYRCRQFRRASPVGVVYNSVEPSLARSAPLIKLIPEVFRVSVVIRF